MKKLISITTLATALIMPITASAFVSDSTGTDGAFNPAENTQLTLPPSGIFNFTDVVIPEGVTVTFAKNSNNTPVYILATGDVTIDGTISVNGGKGGNTGDGTPGVGGPGGFDGGRGGLRRSAGAPAFFGGNGLGPGGGQGGGTGSSVHSTSANSGSGGGFGSSGTSAYGVPGGSTYGTNNLRVLIGGSGGGGAGGYINIGPGGGGSGGAILIASSGTVTINGTITARGGTGGDYNGSAGQPGAGSGGAIRIVATTIQGEGNITAAANGSNSSIAGGNGRIRLEAEEFLRASGTSPAYTFAAPYPVFFSNFPSIRISSIGGEAVSTNPSGYRDVVLPDVTNNPVTVGFETTNIPLGTTIQLIANPERGAETTATSTAVSGSESLGAATAEIELPNGNSTLFGRTSFTISLANAEQATTYSQYAQGEQVEKVRVDVDTNGQSETTFITVSGNEYSWPSSTVALN